VYLEMPDDIWEGLRNDISGPNPPFAAKV
jgi:hypothetical protein